MPKGVVNVYRAIIKTKNINYLKVKSKFSGPHLLVDSAVWEAISRYGQMGGFAGLKLHIYLDTMFDRME